jgi:hypothetical protein
MDNLDINDQFSPSEIDPDLMNLDQLPQLDPQAREEVSMLVGLAQNLKGINEQLGQIEQLGQTRSLEQE